MSMNSEHEVGHFVASDEHSLNSTDDLVVILIFNVVVTKDDDDGDANGWLKRSCIACVFLHSNNSMIHSG